MKAIHISLQIMQFSVFFTLHSFYWNLPAVYKFDSSVFQAILHSGSLPTCIGVHFPIAELDNAICSINLPGLFQGCQGSCCLHNPKWGSWFNCILQNIQGIEVLSFSINTNFKYMILKFDEG